MSIVTSAFSATKIAQSSGLSDANFAATLSDGRVVIAYDAGPATAADWTGQIVDAQGQPVGGAFTLGIGAQQSVVGLQSLPGGAFLAELQTAAGALSFAAYAADGTPTGPSGADAQPGGTPPAALTALADGSVIETRAVTDSTGAQPGFDLMISHRNIDGTAIGGAADVSGPVAGSLGAVLSVAVAGGGYVVAWNDIAASGSGNIYDDWQMRLFAADGAPVGAAVTFLADPLLSAGVPLTTISDLSALALANGGVGVSWLGGGASPHAFFYHAFSAAGAPVGSTIQLTQTGDTGPAPLLTLLSDGSLLAVREAGTGPQGGAQTYADIYDASGSLLTESLILPVAWTGMAVTSLPGDSFLLTGAGPVTDTPAGAAPIYAQVFQEVACFAAGTRIRTTRGDVAVERLQVGAYVPVRLGGVDRRIVWIGHRRVDCARHPRPHDVWPVRVHAHAFGPGQPYADLVLSPDHAVHVGGVLIPVRYLINGATVVQEPAASVTYYHVELTGHDVLLAEGLPCESYLDTGNRHAFADAGVHGGLDPSHGRPLMLHPAFSRDIWDRSGCAALALDGPPVAAAKRRLLAAAAAQGHGLTDAPELRILAGGRIVPATNDGMSWRVRLPPAASAIQLVSRVWVPAHADPGESDTRRLGVAVSNIRVDGVVAAPDGDAFGAGWHPAEAQWRWTDGSGELRAPGGGEVTFSVRMTGRYWADAPDRQAAPRTGQGAAAR